MESRLVQGALAAALVAFAVAALAWAVRTFVESVLVANVIISGALRLSGSGEYALSLVVVVALSAVAYLLFNALLRRIRDKQAPPGE